MFPEADYMTDEQLVQKQNKLKCNLAELERPLHFETKIMWFRSAEPGPPVAETVSVNVEHGSKG